MKNNIPSSGQSNEVSKPSGDTTQSTIDQMVKALASKTDILGSAIPTAQVILDNPDIKGGIEKRDDASRQLKHDLVHSGDIDENYSLDKVKTTLLPPEILKVRKENAVARGQKEIRSAVLDDEGNLVDYSGKISHDRRLIILIGLPASGKSTVANIISASEKARVLDNDEYKKMFKEYSDGLGSSLVHDESQDVEKEILKKAMADGENIVLPKVGGNSEKMEEVVKQAKDAHYTVSVQYVDLAWNKSLSRMLDRFQKTQRLLPLDALFKNFDMPVEKGIEERAHLEIEAAGNDGLKEQKNRLQESLQGTGWAITPGSPEGNLDLTWNPGQMDFDFVLNKAKSMNLGWSDKPDEGLKDPIWQMLLPERALATACKEANISTVSLTVDDSQCYKIRKTFEYLKSEVLSLEHGDSFARWDTDVREDEQAILKEHKGDAIDLYAKEGRLLKVEELQTGERNHVRNQHSRQENAPRDGPRSDKSERRLTKIHDVRLDGGDGAEVRAPDRSSDRGLANQNSSGKGTVQLSRVPENANTTSGSADRSDDAQTKDNAQSTRSRGVHQDVRPNCWTVGKFQGNNAFFFRHKLPTAEESKVRDFLEHNAGNYTLGNSLSKPGICVKPGNSADEKQESQISDFLTNTMKCPEVHLGLDELKNLRENDLNHGRNGQHRGR